MKLKKKLSLLLATIMLANNLSVVTIADTCFAENTQQDSVVSEQAVTVDEGISSQALGVETIEEKDFDIEFKVNSDWGNGFNGEITIYNNTSKAIESWSLSFDFEHNIDSLWNGVISEHTGDYYVVSNAGYNSCLLNNP